MTQKTRSAYFELVVAGVQFAMPNLCRVFELEVYYFYYLVC